MMAIAIALAACTPTRREASPDSILRVSTHFGVSKVSPEQRQTTAANLLDLVYLPLGRHFEALRRDGAVVILTRSLTSVLGATDLCAAMRHPDLIEARAVDGLVQLVFAHEATAAGINLDSYLLDVGPYVMEDLTPELLSLRRRHDGPGFDLIVVKDMATEEEEWRRLLARDVDVVPFASPAHLRYLRQVPSVTIALAAHPATIGLFFQLRDESPLKDPALRRAVSHGLRRRPLAAVVTGDPAAAVTMVEDLQGTREQLRAAAPLSRPLRLLVHEGSSDAQLTALVLQEQLASIGVTTAIDARALKPFVQGLQQGDFDLALHYGGHEPRYWIALTCASRGNVIGYCSAEFDAAAAAGDEPRARTILERDLPLTPLYLVNEGVALDGSLCGAKPQYMYDLSWLAEVHPCAPGETL